MKLDNVEKTLSGINKQIEQYKKNIKAFSSSSDVDGLFSDEFEQAAKDLDGLMSKLDELKSNLGSITDISGLESLKSQVRSITDEFNYINESLKLTSTIAGVKPNFGMKYNASDVDNYFNKIIESAKNASRQAGESIGEIPRNVSGSVSDNVTNAIRTINVFAKAVNGAVNKIVSLIRSAVNIVSKSFSAVRGVFDNIKTGVTKIISLFGNLGNRVKSLFTDVESGKKSSGVFNLIGNSATELRSKILLLTGAFNKLFNNELIEKGKKLLSSVNALNTIVGRGNTKEVIDWANSMERAFGLSARGLISDMNELNGVMYGLGMSSKNVTVASENIIIMSNYLANLGLAGGKASNVIDKITSGMKGMTQAIDDLGLSVRDAEMDAFLTRLKAKGGQFANIATDFSSLNEEAKVYVRYASLIEQFTSKYDISGYINSLDTVTGRLNLMSQAWNNFLTIVGSGLTKLLAKVAPMITALINYISQLITRLFSLIGIDVELDVEINEGGISDDLGNINSGLSDMSDNLDDVSKSAKKATGNLQGFDRINTVSSQDDSALQSKFDYSSLMSSMLGEIEDLAKNIKKNDQDIFKDWSDTLDEMTNKFESWAKKVTGRADFDLGFDWKKIKKNLEQVKKNILKVLKSWGLFTVEISLKILDDLSIGRIITSFSDLLVAVTNLASAMTDALIPAFEAFYDIALSPIVKFIGKVANDAIQAFVDELDRWSDWFKDNSDLILKFFESLGRVVKRAWDIIEPRLSGLESLIGDKFRTLGERIREALSLGMQDFIDNESVITDWIDRELPGKLDRLAEEAKRAWSAIRGDEISPSGLDGTYTLWDNILRVVSAISNIGQTAVEIIKELAKDFLEWVKNEGLPYLADTLERISDWLKEHKDQVIDLLERVASIAWEGFKKFVDLVGKLVNFAVEHPNAVVGIFAGLLGLKVGSWFLDSASGMAELITQMKAMKQLGTIAELIGGSGSAAGAAGAGAEAAGAAAGAAGGVGIGVILGVAAAIVAVVAVIADLLSISEDFRNKWSEWGKQLSDAWNRLKDDIFGVKEETDDSLNVFGKLKEAWDQLSLALEPIIELLGDILIPAISTLIDMIGPLVNLIGTGIADAIKGVAWIIKNILVPVIKAILDFNLVSLAKDFINTIKGVKDVATGAISEANATINTNVRSSLSGTSAVTASKIYGHAGGGSIPTGQLFMANENGSAELIGNIDGTGNTNVANNKMIIEAMYAAIKGAMIDFENQKRSLGNVSDTREANININGFGLIDQSTLRELARILRPYLEANDINIADVGFSI